MPTSKLTTNSTSGAVDAAEYGDERRIAIVAGLRTPFVKSGTDYRAATALTLAKRVVAELIARTNLDVQRIDQVVFGQVVPSIAAPNIAREIVLGTGLPRRVDAYTVARACATGTQALVSAARAILHGEADVVICGGADSLSRPPITLQDGAIDVLMQASSARSIVGKVRAMSRLRPRDLLPKPPALRELSTGLTMGQSAEKMAQLNGISRLDQDAFALVSHQRAAAAWEQGIYDAEVMTIAPSPKYHCAIRRDGLVRGDTSVDQLARLKPVFDRRYGSVTAGNSSPLTDGAAALLVMDAEVARGLGYQPLAYVRAWAFVGLDPAWQLLMGPALAIPKLLAKAGCELSDIDWFDIHEAFAAQVLSNLRALKSRSFAEEHLGRTNAVGEINDARLNVYGGSIALGHPFAATGARQLLTMARKLDRTGGGRAVVAQCAAGGLGAAVLLER